MRTILVVRAARGGLSGRRAQAIVIGLVVLVSTGASTLGLGLLADSNAPFDHAFAAQHGADVTATVSGASPAQLAATAHLPGVTGSGRLDSALTGHDHLRSSFRRPPERALRRNSSRSPRLRPRNRADPAFSPHHAPTAREPRSERLYAPLVCPDAVRLPASPG
jgi:hypothetical protein